jgi:hypothetical protein
VFTVRIGKGSASARGEDAELVVFRVGQELPRDVTMAHVGGRRTEIQEACDQVRLMAAEVVARSMCARFFTVLGSGTARMPMQTATGSGQVKPTSSRLVTAGFLAGSTPAERLRPELAERGVIPGIHRNLNKPRRHAADPVPAQDPAPDQKDGPDSTRRPAPARKLDERCALRAVGAPRFHLVRFR